MFKVCWWVSPVVVATRNGCSHDLIGVVLYRGMFFLYLWRMQRWKDKRIAHNYVIQEGSPTIRQSFRLTLLLFSWLFKRRTLALVSKIRQSSQLYINILKEQEKHGFIKKVAANDSTYNVHYYTHQDFYDYSLLKLGGGTVFCLSMEYS